MVNLKAAMNIAASKHLPYLEACYTLSSSLICGTSTSIYTKKYDIFFCLCRCWILRGRINAVTISMVRNNPLIICLSVDPRDDLGDSILLAWKTLIDREVLNSDSRSSSLLWIEAQVTPYNVSRDSSSKCMLVTLFLYNQMISKKKRVNYYSCASISWESWGKSSFFVDLNILVKLGLIESKKDRMPINPMTPINMLKSELSKTTPAS